MMTTMEPARLRLYVAPEWRREGMRHIPLLYPFWGNLPTPKTPFHQELFARHSFDTNLYDITDNALQADAVLLPYAHAVLLRQEPALIAECSAEALRLGKPLVVDGIGDIEFPVGIPNSIVLRYGGYRFLRKDNEVILPPYADDLLEIFCNETLQLRTKSKKPVIGFTGWASLSARQALRTGIKELPHRLRGVVDRKYRACKKGVFFRRRAVSILEQSPLVEPNFLVRQAFSGHTDTAAKNPEELRKEFVNNLLQSDYGLDVRGDANASIRLFEILSLGRIPVIVDTERNFPFSDKLDYRSFALIVDFNDLYRLPRIIADFHAGLSGSEFEMMQKNARDAFVNYFRVDAMTKHIVREIMSRVHSFSARQTQK